LIIRFTEIVTSFESHLGAHTADSHWKSKVVFNCACPKLTTHAERDQGQCRRLGSFYLNCLSTNFWQAQEAPASRARAMISFLKTKNRVLSLKSDRRDAVWRRLKIKTLTPLCLCSWLSCRRLRFRTFRTRCSHSTQTSTFPLPLHMDLGSVIMQSARRVEQVL
jgi:hypothetical protein